MTDTLETIVIDSRFCGPPDSANGGYVCGRLARHLDGPVQVTLRKPPPLNRALRVVPATEDGAAIQLLNGHTLIAEARQAELQLDIPGSPTISEAKLAVQAYTGFKVHSFPTCFVCGPDRSKGDGLQIFAGKLDGREMVASPWEPDISLADSGGYVRSEFLWAALDCPGAFAVIDLYDIPLLLGRLTAQVDPRVRPGERCIVIGWPIAHEGRKHTAGTALFSASGDLLGWARAIWIEGNLA